MEDKLQEMFRDAAKSILWAIWDSAEAEITPRFANDEELVARAAGGGLDYDDIKAGVKAALLKELSDVSAADTVANYLAEQVADDAFRKLQDAAQELEVEEA